MLYAADDEDESLAFVVQEEGMASSQGVWDLRIYHLAHEVGTSAHRLSLQLPRYELYETGSQLRRAAKSISANLVEGYGRRRYKAEYLRFLIFAKASLDETKKHLLYVKDCHPELQTIVSPLWEAADVLGRKFHRFMQQVEVHHRI